MQNFKKTSWYASFSLAVLALLGAGCTTTDTGTNTQTTSATTTEKVSSGSEVAEIPTESSSTSNNTDTTLTTMDTSVYADGTYSATGTYSSPAGKETVPVTLTLVDDVITDISMNVTATNPASKQWQTIFANNFKAMVVGKNINEVNLTKVSGSSLTPKGFNDAIAQIKAEAAI